MNWQVRGLLGALTIIGAVIYGLVLVKFGQSWIAQNAVDIQIAAAASWVVFGALLMTITRAEPSFLAWVDACLVTMVVGMAVLMAAPISEVATGGTAREALHIGVLILANIAMAGVFLSRASRLKLDFAKGVALWFGVMNGLFGLILIILELVA